jgi:hypothetical protein
VVSRLDRASCGKVRGFQRFDGVPAGIELRFGAERLESHAGLVADATPGDEDRGFRVAAINQKCPDGNSRSGNLCRAPISNTSKFGCNAVKGTVPANRTFVNMDGRAYNLTPRDPDTGALLIPPTGVTDPRWGGGGAYKIHQTTVMGNAGTGAVTCRQDDATRQIGCLVQADPCTLGYAGLGAAKWTGNEATSNNQPLNLQVPVGGDVTANALDDAAIKKLLSAAVARLPAARLTSVSVTRSPVRCTSPRPRASPT